MSTKKVTNTKTETKANVEDVAVGDWVADIRAQKDGVYNTIRRKVVTTGLVSYDMTHTVERFIEKLRQGREVRITCNGEDVIRLFPCLDKEFSEMFVTAQTMGELRESLTDISFQIVRKDGQNVSDMRRERNDLVAERKSNPRINVTPDTLVTCPNCGAEFRIGKQLV